MSRLWVKAAAASALLLASAVAFAAYLQPEMLIEFANLVLCN